MGYKYAVLGSGRQGTASGYDLAKFGEAEVVLMIDKDFDIAKTSAEKINNLLSKQVAEPRKVDIRSFEDLKIVLKGIDSFISAVPYYFNYELSKIALEVGANMCDLGGNTDIVIKQLELDDQAKEANVSIIPDCGQVPGMGNSLAVYGMSVLDETTDVYILDGGLDQNPKPPFNYILTFNIAGLTNEYYGYAHFLRNGEIVKVPCFQENEYEEVDFPPLGKLEAFITAGGTSTAPYSFKGRLRTYENKTLRYKGHYQQYKTLMDVGFLEEEKIKVGEVMVSPRDVLHTLLEPKITAKPEDRDLVAIRVKCLGTKDGHKAELILEVLDYYDEITGFTSMERTTGWHASIVAIMMAKNITPRGAKPVELAVPGDLFVSEMRLRGIPLKEILTITKEY